jgi:hypothetical protein
MLSGPAFIPVQIKTEEVYMTTKEEIQKAKLDMVRKAAEGARNLGSGKKRPDTGGSLKKSKAVYELQPGQELAEDEYDGIEDELENNYDITVEGAADKLDTKVTVIVEEIIISQSYETAALVSLLEKKGLLTKDDVIEEIISLRRR